MVAVCTYSRACRGSAKSPLLFYCNKSILEWLLNDCPETNIKVFTPTIDNWSKRKQEESDESFGIPTNYLLLAKGAGNIARTRCDWSSFCFSLVKNWREIFWPISTRIYFRQLFEN